MSMSMSDKFRGLESNQRPPGSEPGITTNSNCPGSGVLWDTAIATEVRGEGLEPPSPGSKPGSLPLADPRSINAECPARVELASPAWKAGAFAARPRAHQGGRRESRTPKAFVARPLSRRLPSPVGLPFRLSFRKAAAAGIEPASGRLTAAYPYQHGSHRNRVGVAGFEPALSCSRSTRNPRLSYTPLLSRQMGDSKSTQPESNRHILHGEQIRFRYIMGA
jgi:hypothetical protein